MITSIDRLKRQISYFLLPQGTEVLLHTLLVIFLHADTMPLRHAPYIIFRCAARRESDIIFIFTPSSYHDEYADASEFHAAFHFSFIYMSFFVSSPVSSFSFFSFRGVPSPLSPPYMNEYHRRDREDRLFSDHRGMRDE